jgi:asparagine synthase (glutamine-hydrolysing)
MCGIFGSAHVVGVVDNDFTKLALSAMSHRGPDSAGVWRSTDRRVGLGHLRLSILDLSAASNQPMTSSDGRFTIVYNGEIYNHSQLRAELINLGYTFATRGDTEVLLYAFHQWREHCLAKLNGMFSFVIYDHGSIDAPRSVFFARDRAGEKPFYYISEPRRFVFASELKALPRQFGVSINALNYYLALGYIPGDLSFVDGVSKLPPAHCGQFFLDSGELNIWPYWHIPANIPDPKADEVALSTTAGRLIEDSVRMRLEADVPIGVLLSGGLDSSLVAAAAARVSPRPVQTFTIALPGSALDEAHHAQKVASYLGTQHHVLQLDNPSLSLLDGLTRFVDEPIADSSILPAWLVFGLARKHVTVALGGDGGDELFGGYTDYTTSLSDKSRWGRIPNGVFSLIAQTASRLPAGVKGRNRLASLRGGPLQQMIWGRPYFDWTLRRRIFRRDAWECLDVEKEAPENFLLKLFLSGTTDVDRMTRTHFGSILPDDFLVKVDRASMAHSLEVRAPMLDHRLIEFCFAQVPDDWKVKNGESRRLQRLLADRWLPTDLDTRRKQGFSIPINEWLRAEGEARLMVRMESLPALINLDEVRALVRGHLAGRANGGRLFALIMLAIAMKNLSA